MFQLKPNYSQITERSFWELGNDTLSIFADTKLTVV